MAVQSILFDRKIWNITKAKNWLKMNKFKSKKVDVKTNTLRFRQINPKNFKRFRSKKITSSITFIIGF